MAWKDNWGPPAILNKRSAFKCSDSEHNSNQDSCFSRGKLPTLEHRVLDSKRKPTKNPNQSRFVHKIPFQDPCPFGAITRKLCQLRLWIVPSFGEHRNWNQELQLLLRIRWRGSSGNVGRVWESLCLSLSSPGCEENSSGAPTNTPSAAQAGDTHPPCSRSTRMLECVPQLTDDSA